ncbi:MAG: D-glycero-beta-D-manno-heptose 1,7-bisphosphate 7-phosphatase [Leptospiraceae bacterium]|nr:D-glycero-beta-D-manno-heptose 1,7-bisphosphate 7-phosphatase [Leptospiraceae bacterium]
MSIQQIGSATKRPTPGMVILDRDGVINYDSDHYIRSLQDWIPIPGSIEAIVRLAQSGMRIAVASNQSGLGRGFFKVRDLNRMHGRLLDLLARHQVSLEVIALCPHLPGDQCDCRKPAPGMLQHILQTSGLSAGQCVYIGDSFRDWQAAERAGIPFVHVLSGKGARELQKHADDWPASVQHYSDLEQWSLALLAGRW